jgi:hypothetical protein
MGLAEGSLHLTDAEFLAAFESCTLAPSQFRHADHLRLAWIYLHRHPLDEALARVRSGIQAFAAHHGATGLYHETITAAWVRLLASHDEPTFAEFLARHEARLGKDLLHKFWTPELLASAAAKSAWVAPDLQPLPR